MRRTRQTSAVHIPVMAILSAVLCGCAFLVPAAGSAATITVEIIKPVDDQVVFDVGKEYDFEAVAFIEGVELPGGEVTWDWDFGDETDHAFVNPARHAYAQPGNYTITVTATYAAASLAQPQQGAVRAAAGAISGSAQLKATAEPPSLKNELKLVARNGVGEFGGAVCDCVQVTLRYAPEPPPAGTGPTEQWNIVGDVVFSRKVNEQWQEVGRAPAEYIDSRQEASVTWMSDWDHNTDAVEWRAQANFHGLPQGPGYIPPQFWASRDEAWTPKNVVVKSVGPDAILHHKNDPPHRIDWTVSHLVDASLGINPVFPVVVTIYDVSGNPVYTSQPIPTAPGEDGGSLVWSPTFPEGGDRNAIFTYRVSACLCCYDCDKDFDIPRPQITRCNISIDVPNMIGTFDFDYKIEGGDLDEAKAVIYDPGLGEIGCQEYGLLRNGSTGTTHYTVNLSPSGPWGAFTVLLKGKQSDTWAKYANRDEEVKTAIARGAVGAILPNASILRGDWLYLDPLPCMDALCERDVDTDTIYTAGCLVPTARMAIEAMHKSAITVISGHANPTRMGLGTGGPGIETEHKLYGYPYPPGSKKTDDDALDIYYISNQPDGHLGRSLLVVFAGCHTWNDSPTTEDYAPEGLVAAALAKGASAVLGTRESIYPDQTTLYLGRFFHYACGEGSSLGESHIYALLDVTVAFPFSAGGVNSFRCTNPGLELKAARWAP